MLAKHYQEVIYTSKIVHFSRRGLFLRRLVEAFPDASPGTAPSAHDRIWRLGVVRSGHDGH